MYLISQTGHGQNPKTTGQVWLINILLLPQEVASSQIRPVEPI